MLRARPLPLITSLFVLACVPPKSSDGPSSTESSEATSSTSGEGESSSTTDSETTETETGEPECNDDLYLECRADVSAAYNLCRASCEGPETCAGVACRWACLGERDYGNIDCALQLCPERLYDFQECEAQCHALTGECPLTPDCHPNDCLFVEMVCVAENCHPCEEVSLTYEYADSCEIALPGSVPDGKQGYTQVEVQEPDYLNWGVSDLPELCGEGAIGGVWWTPDHDGISLCPEACDAFALAGTLMVVFGSPPCE